MQMQIDDDVTQEDIKTAYRQLAKYCHPDVNDDGHELCILLNEVSLPKANTSTAADLHCDLLQ